MTEMTDPAQAAYLDAMLHRAKLNLSAEERAWLDIVFEGFRAQIDALHAVNLDGEAIGSDHLRSRR